MPPDHERTGAEPEERSSSIFDDPADVDTPPGTESSRATPRSEFVWANNHETDDDVPTEHEATRPDGGFAGPSDRHDEEMASLRELLGRYTPNNRQKLGVGVLALVALLFLTLGAGPVVAHTSFTASDVSFTSNSGQLTSLTVAPEGDVHYNGLESPPSSVDIAVMVRLNSSSAWETVDSKSVSASGLEGSVNYSFAEINLLSQSSMASSDFRAADGSTSTTTVDIQIEATLVGAGPGGGDVVATSGDTYTVTVTNEAAGGQVGGQANTGGSAA